MATYFDALKVSRNASLADIKAAYAKAAKSDHPDVGGSESKWALISAAFTELKAMANKKRGGWGRNGDLAWARNWSNLNAPVKAEPKQDAPKDEPKAEETSTERGDRCDHKHRDGEYCGRKAGHSGQHIKESTYAAHKDYSKVYSKARYNSDPEYAARLREASKVSHAKGRAAAKAAKQDAAK